ncbi:hypothetical protein G3I34_22940 [Streptomyces sp. SID8014]|uniref:hypothetical protein n=1 Tax=Streptomyces sp. SID8014 TaxID=2706097 RepID=UPI0013B60E98|nr:hypothetical protein [Streptomyces sp. SID8014]NEC15071.1 hypothetical protein [Streptomyces sp. SID8014]
MKLSPEEEAERQRIIKETEEFKRQQEARRANILREAEMARERAWRASADSFDYEAVQEANRQAAQRVRYNHG